MMMTDYKLEVTTGNMTFAGTFDHIHITLIGNRGHSKRTELDNIGVYFKTEIIRLNQL